jgi:membrane peptidoglycan carboxypeptidase
VDLPPAEDERLMVSTARNAARPTGIVQRRRRRRDLRPSGAKAKRAGLVATALVLGTLLVSAAVIGAGAAVVRQFFDHTTAAIASPGEIVQGLAVYGGAQIYDRNGKLLYRFPDAAGGLQIPVALSDVSPHLIAATVSTEDSNYWTSPGVNLHGTIAAAGEPPGAREPLRRPRR